MVIDSEFRHGTLRLHFAGDFVRGSDIERLPELVTKKLVSRVILDFRAVPRIDAYGLGLLLQAADRAEEAGAHLEVVNVCDTVYDAIEVCRLQRYLHVSRGGPGDSAHPHVA